MAAGQNHPEKFIAFWFCFAADFCVKVMMQVPAVFFPQFPQLLRLNMKEFCQGWSNYHRYSEAKYENAGEI